MQENEIKALLIKYRAGQCNDEEIAFLESWYAQWNQKIPLGLSPEELASDLRTISKNIPSLHQAKQRALWPQIAAAASILLFLFIGGYYIFHKQASEQTAQQNDVKPGGHQAILTLSNGQKVVLNDQQKGKIASQGNTAIMLAANGRVTYQNPAAASTSNPTEVIYNTLTIPIGNHRDITLADGSEVSLDAGSSITYPVAFNGKERSVSVTGQAYFKVKHDEAHPFGVKVKQLYVQDIGTEFNINAYDDETAIKTTLVEGSVKVTLHKAPSPNEMAGDEAVTLTPGQQAVAKNNTASLTVRNADIAAVTAWKDDNFLFRNQDLKATMRQVARWYQVNIIYYNAPEHLRIWADISRSRNLSVLLKAMEQTGKVKFRIAGRNVYVSQ